MGSIIESNSKNENLTRESCLFYAGMDGLVIRMGVGDVAIQVDLQKDEEEDVNKKFTAFLDFLSNFQDSLSNNICDMYVDNVELYNIKNEIERIRYELDRFGFGVSFSKSVYKFKQSNLDIHDSVMSLNLFIEFLQNYLDSNKLKPKIKYGDYVVNNINVLDDILNVAFNIKDILTAEILDMQFVGMELGIVYSA